MQARHAARELALLTLCQLESQGEGALATQKIEMSALMMASVRALRDLAEETIRVAADQMAAVSQSILALEQDHPQNLQTPMGTPLDPVPIPTTREMVEQIEQCLLGAEYLFEALRIPEFIAHAKSAEAQQYAIRLIQLVQTHQSELETLINECSDDWKVDRMMKLDRFILELAAAEMKYIESVDASVSINEAVELAKRFCAEESYRFINGVLGKLEERLSGQTIEVEHV